MKVLTIFFLTVSLLGQSNQKPPKIKRPEGKITVNPAAAVESPTGVATTVAASLTVTAGTLTCVFTMGTSEVRADCNDTSATPSPATANQVTKLPISFGSQGDIAYAKNSIVWIFVPFSNPNAPSLCPKPAPTAGHCWQIAANDVMKTGSW